MPHHGRNAGQLGGASCAIADRYISRTAPAASAAGHAMAPPMTSGPTGRAVRRSRWRRRSCPPPPRSPQNRSRVLGLARADDLPLRGHQIDRDHAVAGPAAAAGQIAEPPAQRESGDAGGRDEAEHRRQPVELGLAVDVAEQTPRLRPGQPGARVHPHPAHERHVEHDGPIDYRETRDVVAAPLDRERKAVLSGKTHRRHHVSHAEAADHERGVAVDHAVPDRAAVLVDRIGGADKGTAKAGPERVDPRGVRPGRRGNRSLLGQCGAAAGVHTNLPDTWLAANIELGQGAR